jgi:hypothetical protein
LQDSLKELQIGFRIEVRTFIVANEGRLLTQCVCKVAFHQLLQGSLDCDRSGRLGVRLEAFDPCHSVIGRYDTALGLPVARQAVWQVCNDQVSELAMVCARLAVETLAAEQSAKFGGRMLGGEDFCS